jgi:hypothetical protein
VAVKTDDNNINLRGLHNHALLRVFTASATSSTVQQGVVLLRSPSTNQLMFPGVHTSRLEEYMSRECQKVVLAASDELKLTSAASL